MLESTRLSLFDDLFSNSSSSPKYLSGHRQSRRTCCTAALFALSIYVREKERGKASVLLSLNEAWPFLACLGHPSLSSATAIRSIIVVVFFLSRFVSFSNQAEWDNQSVVK